MEAETASLSCAPFDLWCHLNIPVLCNLSAIFWLLFLAEAEDYLANAHLNLMQPSAFSEGKEAGPESPVEGS